MGRPHKNPLIINKFGLEKYALYVYSLPSSR